MTALPPTGFTTEHSNFLIRELDRTAYVGATPHFFAGTIISSAGLHKVRDG